MRRSPGLSLDLILILKIIALQFVYVKGIPKGLSVVLSFIIFRNVSATLTFLKRNFKN